VALCLYQCRVILKYTIILSHDKSQSWSRGLILGPESDSRFFLRPEPELECGVLNFLTLELEFHKKNKDSTSPVKNITGTWQTWPKTLPWHIRGCNNSTYYLTKYQLLTCSMTLVEPWITDGEVSRESPCLASSAVVSISETSWKVLSLCCLKIHCTKNQFTNNN